MTERREGPSAAARIRVMKRDRFQCTYCGAPGTHAELEVDHIIAVANGGSHHISNLTTACRKCNQAKGASKTHRRPMLARDSARGIPPDTPTTEYFPPLQCGLIRVEVDFRLDLVVLHLPWGECTDMTGAIAYALGLCPGVRRIHTIAGGRPDTSYARKADDQWTAHMAPRVVETNGA